LLPYELRLKEDEKLEYDASISKASIIMIWAVVPAVFLVIFLTAYLPVLIKISVESEIRSWIFEQLGVEEIGLTDMRDALYMLIFSSLPVEVIKFISGMAAALITLLVAAWLGWACVYTYLNTRYALIITDTRVFAKARGKAFEAEFGKILNVAVAQSLFGKIFGYGEIHIQSEKDAITVCNIVRAKSVRNVLWAKVNKD